MADVATIGEIAYLAWWGEYDPDGRYRRDAWADLPHRHRNSWQAAAEAAAAEVAARKAAMAGHGQPATGRDRYDRYVPLSAGICPRVLDFSAGSVLSTSLGPVCPNPPRAGHHDAAPASSPPTSSRFPPASARPGMTP